MGVKEELEALRNSGVATKNASKLKDATGLSTPEEEAKALKAEQERTGIANYGKEADSNLKSYNEAKNTKTTTAATDTATATATATASPSSPSKKAAPAKTTPPAPAATAAAAPVASTVNDDDDDDDDDVPALEELPDMEDIPSMETTTTTTTTGTGRGVTTAQTVAAPAPATTTVNRAERKARRMMEKLGMKKVSGISQVVLKMSAARGGVFTITAPDVFEKNGSYVVFGEARQGGGAAGGQGAGAGAVSAQQQQAQAIQQLAAMARQGGGGGAGGGFEMPAAAAAAASAAAGSESVKIEEVSDDNDANAIVVDETGLEDKDIDLVLTQAGCSRSKAVQALKDNDGDLVNAIMSLTT